MTSFYQRLKDGEERADALASPQGNRLIDGSPADCFLHSLLNDL